jgi:hypothetical protein
MVQKFLNSALQLWSCCLANGGRITGVELECVEKERHVVPCHKQGKLPSLLAIFGSNLDFFFKYEE